MSKVKITNRQLKTLFTLYTCGPSTLVIASATVTLAKQDAWLSVVVASAVGLMIIWLNSTLGGLYPQKTYVEIIQLLLGKWIGGFVIANIFLLFIIATTQTVWYIGDFFQTQYMPETPATAITTLFVAIVCISVLYGLETIARASEIFYSIVIVLFFSSMLFVAPNIKANHLLPMLEGGILPVLKGALPVLAFTVVPLLPIMMIYPAYTTDIKEAKKSLLKGYLIGMSILFVSVLMSLLVLGTLISANARFPIFLLTKEINIGIIFTRLEALIVFVWILTIFQTTTLLFFGANLTLTQWLHIKDYKKNVLPLGLILAVLTTYIYKSVPHQLAWDTLVWPFYVSTFGIAMTLFLLIITLVKKKLHATQK